MHRIEPARLKPGATQDTLPGPRPSDAAAASDRAAPAIRGRALIFWDPKNPGRKLDAIDTDQITPAADCVSESLETLDERWKAGSFRHLMPDFRARVHRGENFLIAGERFAIGSSREMSPAGLKGVAEEKGLELVDRLQPRHGRHLPAQCLQPRAPRRAVPRGGRRRTGRRRVPLRPCTRRLTNETQGKSYTPVPLSPKEEEIRSSGGIFAVGRREFRKSVEALPEVNGRSPSWRGA